MLAPSRLWQSTRRGVLDGLVHGGRESINLLLPGQ